MGPGTTFVVPKDESILIWDLLQNDPVVEKERRKTICGAKERRTYKVSKTNIGNTHITLSMGSGTLKDRQECFVCLMALYSYCGDRCPKLLESGAISHCHYPASLALLSGYHRNLLTIVCRMVCPHGENALVRLR